MEGEKSGKKMNADAAVKRMRGEYEGNEKMFQTNEYLSISQVQSLFSRMATKLREEKLNTLEKAVMMRRTMLMRTKMKKYW